MKLKGRLEIALNLARRIHNQQEMDMRPFLKLFPEDNNELVIQTNIQDEAEVLRLLSERIAEMGDSNPFGEDAAYRFRSLLHNTVDLCCKLRGYKAPLVDEQRVLTAGKVSLKAETELMQSVANEALATV